MFIDAEVSTKFGLVKPRPRQSARKTPLAVILPRQIRSETSTKRTGLQLIALVVEWRATGSVFGIIADVDGAHFVNRHC